MANAIAYGFHGLKDVFTSGAFDNNAIVPKVRDALIQSAEEHSRQMNALLDTMVSRIVFPKQRVQLGAGGTLQPIDEWGNPLPTRGGAYYETGFPIQGGGDAIGTNRVSRVKMTIQDMNDRILDIQTKDSDWIMRHCLAAMFDNVSWTFTDADPAVGSLTVKPLANGDTDLYSFSGLNPTTDNHYLFQAAAIADLTNPFPALRTELDEHSDNAEPYVAYVPTALVGAITALEEFIRLSDPNVSTANVSTLNSDGAGVLRMGTSVLGYLETSRLWIVEWKRLPATHILGVSLGARTPAVAMREYPEPALRGLFNEFHSSDGNLQVERFLRYAGFGALNRTAAAALHVGAGAYAIPTGYNAPLPN